MVDISDMLSDGYLSHTSFVFYHDIATRFSPVSLQQMTKCKNVKTHKYYVLPFVETEPPLKYFLL